MCGSAVGDEATRLRRLAFNLNLPSIETDPTSESHRCPHMKLFGMMRPLPVMLPNKAKAEAFKDDTNSIHLPRMRFAINFLLMVFVSQIL